MALEILLNRLDRYIRLDPIQFLPPGEMSAGKGTFSASELSMNSNFDLMFSYI